MDVNVYLGKEMMRSDAAIGQKYEVVIYPAPDDHQKIAEIIKTALERSEAPHRSICRDCGCTKKLEEVPQYTKNGIWD